jgi:integrase
VRGSVFLRCACRDPESGKFLHGRCPKLGKVKGHGSWWFRYSAPGPGGKRRQPMVGPFATKKAAEEELSVTLARLGAGGNAPDRSLTVSAYLTAFVAGKIDLKPRTLATSQEAIDLYWIPALGHLRLVDLRDHHVAEVIREMMKINRSLPDAEAASEMMRRLLAVRAESVRRNLAPGERRPRKSTKPLSPARIRRMFAVLNGALNAAVPGKIPVNPCAGVILPRARAVRPLPWTPEREAAFRASLEKQEAEASAERELTRAERQRMWATARRPSPVMVWMPAHAGAFLDFIETERLYALFCLASYCGLRRGEIIGLTWAEVDLDQGIAYVRETGDGDDPKSEAGIRPIPLPAPALAALKSWRKRQTADRLAWGPDWPETDRVFTREDGTPVPPQWLSVRFETLAYRAALPPVRFHDLRHGAASLCKAAGLDTKFISALLGHSRTSFTDATYVLLFPEVAKAAAETAAAAMPRRSRQAGEGRQTSG